MKFKRALIATLALTSLTGSLTFGPSLSVQATENPNAYINSQTNNMYSMNESEYNGHDSYHFDFLVTEDNVEELWHKFFDEQYNDLVFKFTEAGSQAFWDNLHRIAVEEVNMMSEEELAEIERELEQRRQEEEHFWENLSPEFLWELYVKDNPQVLRMRSDEVSELKEAVKKSYYDLIKWREYQGIDDISAGAAFWANAALETWTNQFAADAGVSLAARQRMTIIAGIAWADARITSTQEGWGWGSWREDAYRHWLWNATSVRDPGVGSTQAQRVTNTRIFTTYREIVTYIHRHETSLRTTNPTAAQLQMGRNMRNAYLNMNQATWVSESFWGLNTPNGRAEQMDLWNNHWGRFDGVAGAPTLARFNTRWNDTSLINGLVRSDTTAFANMEIGRQRHIHSSGWHRP